MKYKYLKSFKLSVALFILLFALNTVVYMTKNMFSAAMASIVEAGVMTKSQTGAISAAFWLVYAISQVVGGLTVDKYSPSRLIIIGLVSGIVSNFLIYVNQNYWFIISVWCINAAFQFGLWPGIFKIVTTQTAPEFRGTALFYVLFSTSAGQAISMLVASVVPKWQHNFIISVVALIFILILWIVIYEILEKYMVDGEKIKSQTKEITDEHTLKIGKLLRVSGLPVLLAISLLINMMVNGIKVVTPVMLMESYDNLPAAIATRLSVILIVFSVFGMFIANIIRTKITNNEIKAIKLLLIISVPITAVSYFVGRLNYFTILGFLAVSVAILQGAQPFSNSFAAARFTIYGRGGTVSGILNAMCAMGNLFASYIFPLMSETMSWNYITGLWCILTIVGIALSLLINRKWTEFIEMDHIFN